VPATVGPLSWHTRLPQTGKTMETKASIWKGVKKSEKLSIAILALCIVALAAIIIVRPF